MGIGLLFWILMILWFIFGLGFIAVPASLAWGPNALLFILLALLGWKTFGPALHA